MNVARRKLIVVLGFLSHFPVAGVAWQTVHYLLGFQRLGFDVFYVEAHGCAPSKLMRDATDDGPRRAAEYIDRILRQFDLGDCWAYHSRYPSDAYFGLSESRLHALYQSADWLINLHGSHLPTAELAATGRMVYLETDPVEVEIDLSRGCQKTHDYLAPHCAFFTYGENLGRPDCQVPNPSTFSFLPTRQPVVLDLWRHPGGEDAARFTTVGNWRQPWREVSFQGQVYRWSKHFEFLKFIDLPRRSKQAFELALSGSSLSPEDRRLLERQGWHVRDALEFSHDLTAYRRYITESRGEFTVAKDQNIRLRSGWFSDRAATYLAASRPVISQDTAFNSILPTGKGLFSFSTLDQVLEAVETINADYSRHCQAAGQIAREYFGHDVVLGSLLRHLGDGPRAASRAAQPASAALPDDLIVQPVSRWPTRLPDATWELAVALPTPTPTPAITSTVAERRASIVMVTHNGLAYTKLCLTSLFDNGWHPQDQLILVDNASTDDTPRFLQELQGRLPFVRVVLNPDNRGFAAANNQGLALATGRVLILLNNDTLLLQGWQDRLIGWLENPEVGLVGPVTNRTCNEAQIDAPYRSYAELREFARDYTSAHQGQGTEVAMLAMFCAALRRDVFDRVGTLDEQFEVGMFEDDDYARRIRQQGFRVICAEDVYVHHFGQGSMGELCATGQYDRVLLANRRRFEIKWNLQWQPHGRRITSEYSQLRQRLQSLVDSQLAPNASVLVISKGDDELLNLRGRLAWHFPGNPDGRYANLYPADSSEAIQQLESWRARGATSLVIPKPASWWLDFYSAFAAHLRRNYHVVADDPETGLIFSLEERHA
jgi:GT2 family glycosyltransferase